MKRLRVPMTREEIVPDRLAGATAVARHLEVSETDSNSSLSQTSARATWFRRSSAAGLGRLAGQPVSTPPCRRLVSISAKARRKCHARTEPFRKA